MKDGAIVRGEFFFDTGKCFPEVDEDKRKEKELHTNGDNALTQGIGSEEGSSDHDSNDSNYILIVRGIIVEAIGPICDEGK